MGLFKDMKFNVDMDDFSDAKFWCNLINEAIGTGLWVIIGTTGGGTGWAWGIGYAILSIAFGGSYNCLSNFSNFCKGDESIFGFLFAFLAQAAGVMAAHHIAGPLGIATTKFDATVAFDNAFSGEWKSFWFGSEVVGIFLYACFVAKAKNHDLPKALFDVLMVATAFMIAGAGFGFFPGHLFASGWGSFTMMNTWATFCAQLFATLLAEVVLEFAW